MVKSKYRVDIDGLRAWAVLPVILFHAGIDVFPGGYVGVDVFFVISGYLITGVILDQFKQGTFTFSHFYFARARRILPALFFMFFITSVAAWILMIPSDLAGYGGSLSYAAAFLANLYFKDNVNYFSPAAESMPLLHTWSLAIEEQYYLIFPLLVVLVWKKSSRTLSHLLIILFFISFGLSLLGAVNFKMSNYYLLPTRAWELLFGGLLFIHKDSLLTRRIDHSFFTILGLLLIVWACLSYDKATPFPSMYTLIPVIGAGLILNGKNEGLVIRGLLKFQPVVGIGKISYSLYLWHFPIFAFGALLYSSYGVKIGIFWSLIAIVLIALISYKLIEQPTRYLASSPRYLLSFLLIVGLSLCGFGYLLHKDVTAIKSLNVPQQGMLKLFDEGQSKVKWENCSTVIDEPCIGGDTSSQRVVVLFGDSHAFAIYEALSDDLRDKGLKLVLYTDGNCPPIYTGQSNFAKNKCLSNNYRIYKKISDDPMVDAVVLVARWAWYIESKPFDNLAGGVGASSSGFLSSYYHTNTIRRDTVIELLSKTLDYTAGVQKRFVIVDTIPEPGWDVQRKSFYLSDQVSDLSNLFSYDRKIYLDRNAEMINILQDRVNQSNLHIVSTLDSFCGAQSQYRCNAWLMGVPLYFDDNHLNKNGAKLLVPSITNAIIKSRELK
jgi:peptidoglycan/LPS O-acetylase OafA/YrhL